MFNRILVPLDGSTLAERAIPHAEQFARIFGSSIILLQVLDPVSYHENPSSVDPLSWQIRKTESDMYLQGIAARVREDLHEEPLGTKGTQDQAGVGTKTKVEYSIREGKTAENIVNFAHSENIDLLIICTHGAGGLSRWNISSVTQKVINLIYLPVLIVRAYHQPATLVDRVHYRRILLPIDSSRRAECSLSAGIALARGEMALRLASEPNNRTNRRTAPVVSPAPTKLILTAVIKPPELPIPEPYPIEIEQLSQQLMDISREAVSNYLIEMKERLPVECETRVLENISVSAAIQELASQEEDIDLVVLCAHGYTGQFAWPYGSIARNYIEHGTKPVLVIQDVPRSQVQLTAAELAAQKSGGR
ncbi:universal stress protein UspA [Longilinea arvoryzae]|uniref:Universal stress protein UspA n=1 Tax=Longilinea arvoryzae TaxID=360412 RepID=A0A0S7B803_9CHLR|nr:universal stress protein [Longilinea arvoryzae]GAP13583.1 universal stress protein UspA [Longilinea arvoryzae]